MYLNKMSFEKRYKLPSGKKMGFCEKPCAQTPFSLGNVCSREICFCLVVLAIYIVFLFILFICLYIICSFCLYCFCVRVLVFGGAKRHRLVSRQAHA